MPLDSLTIFSTLLWVIVKGTSMSKGLLWPSSSHLTIELFIKVMKKLSTLSFMLESTLEARYQWYHQIVGMKNC
jgi:hypothetical protein